MTSRESLRWTLLILAVVVLSGTAFYFSMKNRPQVAIQVSKIVPAQIDQK